MTPSACARCGQLLLPELVRQVGGGTKCPFCSAPLPGAREAKPPAPPARTTMVGHVGLAPTSRAAPAATKTLVGTPAPAPPPPAIPKPRTEALGAVPAPAPLVPTALVARLEPTPARDEAAPGTKGRRIVAVGLAVVATAALVAAIGSRGRARPDALARPVVAVASAPPPLAPEIAPAPAEVEAPPAAPVEAPPAERPPRARVLPERVAREQVSRHVVRRRHEKPRRAVAMKSASATPKADSGAAHAAYQQGNTALFSGDVSGAVEAYREAVRRAPKDPVGYRGLGLAFEKQGMPDDAIVAFRRYLKLAPRARDRELIAQRLQRLAHPSPDEAR